MTSSLRNCRRKLWALIVPDIFIEALSAPYPLILRHRTAAHFMICSLMFIISTVGCSSGGASVVSVLAHTQGHGFRLLMVALESVVILQFYGARRLSIDEHAMTNRDPSTFVKICWTSVVPLLIALAT
ncbi:sodium- and chloride-dependent GABA transporter 1-like [Dermacentor variabilis]|uniref:sodium- and chloride-dependent GABA transporter 1-like n=1 Tax=Dermacentor variabilis TaxID=34621 RepID=UPI003F5B1AB6